ncbi:serine protease inhibitor 2-like [Aphomia sociella]
MYSSFYIILFAAPFLYTSSGSVQPIDQHILEDIFGPLSYVASASSISQVSQAAPVRPSNDTAEEAQYFENLNNNDYYAPPAIDYDRFDWALTKRVASASSNNFLLSPLGVKLALAILTEAATGPTHSELAAVLGFDLDKNVTRKKYSSIIESLKISSPEYILNLGSRIYLEQSIVPKQKFAAIAKDFYDTELKRTNFSETAVASKEINDWVTNVTHGRITNLVDHDDLASAVILILNTLFFKGSWRHQFSPNATKPGNFYVSPSEAKLVPMMKIKERFYYVETTKYDAKILRMPYLGRKYAMYIVVPNSLTGLLNVLNGLSDLQTEMNFLKERTVNVVLPRFNFDYTAILDEVLKEMGIRLLFEDTANLPGISRGQGLYQRLKVSRVLQRSGIEVNELGSVAYSATEISLVNKFGEDDDVSEEVLANKPFLFFIQDEATRQLLFTGRVTDPLILDGAFH